MKLSFIRVNIWRALWLTERKDRKRSRKWISSINWVRLSLSPVSKRNPRGGIIAYPLIWVFRKLYQPVRKSLHSRDLKKALWRNWRWIALSCFQRQRKSERASTNSIIGSSGVITNHPQIQKNFKGFCRRFKITAIKKIKNLKIIKITKIHHYPFAQMTPFLKANFQHNFLNSWKTAPTSITNPRLIPPGAKRFLPPPKNPKKISLVPQSLVVDT